MSILKNQEGHDYRIDFLSPLPTLTWHHKRLLVSFKEATLPSGPRFPKICSFILQWFPISAHLRRFRIQVTHNHVYYDKISILRQMASSVSLEQSMEEEGKQKNPLGSEQTQLAAHWQRL